MKGYLAVISVLETVSRKLYEILSTFEDNVVEYHRFSANYDIVYIDAKNSFCSDQKITGTDTRHFVNKKQEQFSPKVK